MSKLEQIDEYADETDEKVLLLGEEPKDFEEAIIGIAYRYGMEPSVCYDRDKVIEISKTVKTPMRWQSSGLTTMLSGDGWEARRHST